MFIVESIGGRCHGRANRSGIFDEADPYAIEILQKPVVIQRHGTHDIWTTGECDNADAIVWSSFYEFACDFADRIDSRRFLPADGKIFRQHRARDVEHEHDINPARLDLSKAFAKLRTRQPNYQDRQRSQQQCPQNFSCARGTPFSDCLKSRCRRISQRRSWSALSAQPRQQWDCQQQQEQPGARKRQGTVCRPPIKQVCHVERSRDIAGSTVTTSPPFTKRIASPSSNSLSEVVASYLANLMRSQRPKKSSSNVCSSVENGEAFANAVRNSIEVCRVAGNPYCCVTYFRKMSDTRMLN